MPNISAQGVDIGEPLGDADEAVFVTNKNGGTHDVPANWVTKDKVGDIRVRGNAGFRMASDDEVKEYREAQRPAEEARPAAQQAPPARSAQEAPKRS